MKLIFAVVLVVLVIVSCSKDKFESRPRLTMKEVRGNYVPFGNDYMAQFVFEYTDAEGDIGGQPIYYSKTSSSAPCADAGKDPNIPIDSTVLAFPGDVPESDNQKGEITISLLWGRMKPIPCSEITDSVEQATFKFWFKDRAGNVSDTVTAPPITIRKIP